MHLTLNISQSIRTKNNLESKVKKVLQKNGPILCEVFAREDQSYIEIFSCQRFK